MRLREHFRCVPEIINWSSSQFYDDGSGGSGLIPLRERSSDGLTPLKVIKVAGGVIEGHDGRAMNPVEAREIVETMAKCLRKPEYDGKTFGVVVLRSAVRHIQRIENLIKEYISPEEQQERRIRVGTAPNFQGDERDVIFLSMVVAKRPPKATATSYRQTFNVAASRAKDQLWLFTSVDLDQLAPDDLRASLLGYMLDPPSVFGPSPALDQVSDQQLTEPFGSLFEQRVFRELRGRGYHVVPQYPIGSRRLDLVVAGRAGRIAVECDGHYWHSSVADQISDARRDSELARMNWHTVRIRESEYAFDPERELGDLWQVLRDKGIEAEPAAEEGASDWRPLQLADDDGDEEETE